MRDEKGTPTLRAFECTKCKKALSCAYVANCASLFVREAFGKYYRGAPPPHSTATS